MGASLCLTLHMTPMFFEIFLAISLICGCHERFSSITTPRNFVVSARMMVIPSAVRLVGKLTIFDLLLWKRMKCDFLVFTQSLLAENQRRILANSSDARRRSSGKFLLAKKTLVSSAL